ncbi:MAG: electron transport complex subunit RsxC [Gammaproteobacteria bacterium]|nr:electron transport complex subunit RsxC [Gammaproteobacteria bacterium]
MSPKLWKFHGGLHLPGHKAESTGQTISTMPVATQLIVPVQQHIGAAAHVLVEVGQKVLKGQPIARAEGAVSTSIHAPSSGTVTAIEPHSVPHPSGLKDLCIVIDTDGEDRWATRTPIDDPALASADTLRQQIQASGIVGMGGAGFPSHLKLNPRTHVVETLILNGAECEPYITCDDMLMRERPLDILRGARLMSRALAAKTVVIAIEDNKPEALAAISAELGKAATSNIEVLSIPTLYPTGGERQLIKVVTGKEVPSKGLPVEIGVVCHNVATAAAVYRAVELGEPLVSRIVTITGERVPEPRNLEVVFGTPLQAVLDYCQVADSADIEILMGGPMMGLPLHDTQTPIVKTSNCLLIRQTETKPAALPCIRCGACAEVCPAQLLPQQLYWHARAKAYDRVQDFHLFDCIECGCCDQVCPSNIPLVDYYRFAKTEIWAQEREKKVSDLARERHEFREFRLQREKDERAARHAQKKKAVSSDDAKSDDAKKAAIQAAMDRAKAKRDNVGANAKNTDNLTEAQQRQVEEADQRRAKMKENSGENE